MSATSGPRKSVPSGVVMRRIVNPITVYLGGPTLVVRGRKTGRLLATPVPAFSFGGARHLVGGRGATHWARNLRAAGEGEYRERGRREPFRAVELFGAEREQVLAAYRERHGRRVRALFDELPNPEQHPVFRIEPLQPAERAVGV
jgi:deazaflavin-dependent oxidoreductase (nitroreductase family)